jgi:hypothetical protein
MKRLQDEYAQLNGYKKLAHDDQGAHGHEEGPALGDALAAVCTENAKLKYQLATLNRVIH